jgi:hypothetical protein
VFLTVSRDLPLSPLTYVSAADALGVMGELSRGERLQIMLSHTELRAVDTWRFGKRMPSRASAIRELLRRGLAAEGFTEADEGQRSKDFSVLE